MKQSSEKVTKNVQRAMDRGAEMHANAIKGFSNYRRLVIKIYSLRIDYNLYGHF